MLGASLLAAPLLGACQPLYGPTPSGANLKDVMAAIEISKISGRVGQKLRNELIFSTTRGGRPAKPVYKLEIAVRQTTNSILVERTGDARGVLYEIEASFRLSKIATSEVVFEGKSTGRAAYDRFDPIFTNIRAKLDAEDRAALVVADGIRTRLAAFLSSTA